MGRWNSPSKKDINPDSEATYYNVTDEEKAYWNGKQDELSYDDVPTANSSNVMRSAAILTAIENAKSALTTAYKNYFEGQVSGLGTVSAELSSTSLAVAEAISQMNSLEIQIQNALDITDKRAEDALTYRNSSADSAATSKEYAEQAYESANRVASAISEAQKATEEATAATEAAIEVAAQVKDYTDRAEAAQTAAETAQGAAETAQAVTLEYKDAASTAATNAATSESNASTSAGTATAAATAAAASAAQAASSASGIKDGAAQIEANKTAIENLQTDLETEVKRAQDEEATKITEPTSDGTDGQALVTDGKGGRSWQTVGIDIDDAMSTTSTNPVQNKVANAAIKAVDDKLGGVTFTTTDNVKYINW